MLKKADLENEFILTKKVSGTFNQGCHFYLKSRLNESLHLCVCVCTH